MFKTGKQKFTKEEIIDILKRNVSLFRDEEEFVQYIVDLAMYLVEHRLYTGSDAMEPKRKKDDSGVFIRGREPLRTRARDEELYEVLKKHATRSDARPGTCKMCGAPSQGKVTCPNCGNMAY